MATFLECLRDVRPWAGHRRLASTGQSRVKECDKLSVMDS